MRRQLKLFLIVGLFVLVREESLLYAASAIDQQQPVIDVNVGGSAIGGDSQQKLAQVVTVGVSGFLTEVRFPIACVAADLIVEIQGVTNEKPNGVVFTSESFAGANLPNFFPNPGFVSFRSFPFSRPALLSAGDRIAIVLKSTGATAAQGCGIFQGPVGDSYAGGKAYFEARPNAEGVWVCLCEFPGGRFDLPFQTLMAPPVVDSDGDGVPDDRDECPNTEPEAIVDANGCSIDELVPCAGPRDGGTWRNHGEYVSSVTKTAESFTAAGLITAEQKDAIIAAAAHSGCGKK
jgi:hypothetical protein